jgi:hypothetical protein
VLGSSASFNLGLFFVPEQPIKEKKIEKKMKILNMPSTIRQIDLCLHVNQ